MGTVVLRHPEFIPRSGARVEQFQSVVQRGDVCQPLCRITYHASHVRGMEVVEANQDREVTGNGSGNRHISSR